MGGAGSTPPSAPTAAREAFAGGGWPPRAVSMRQKACERRDRRSPVGQRRDDKSMARRRVPARTKWAAPHSVPRRRFPSINQRPGQGPSMWKEAHRKLHSAPFPAPSVLLKKVA